MRDRRLLLALSAGIPALEALLVVLIGPPAAAALAPQVAAPAPFGVFHDLRWILVYHSSWLGFVVLWIVGLAVRTMLDVLLTRAAWPATVELQSWRDHVRASAAFTAIQSVALLPFAVLVFAMAVTSLSWLFFVAVPVLVMIGLLVHHGAAEATWMRCAPNRSSVTALLGVFALLTVGGGVISALSDWLAPVVAGVTGLGVGALRVRMVHALAGREVDQRGRPFVLVGLASIVALVVVGTAVGFGVALALEDSHTPPPRVSGVASGPPVLIVKGFNTEWDGITRRWVDDDVTIQRFSYRGIAEDGEPQPYARSDTHASIRELVELMRRQVASLRRDTGRSVTIVAESEGSLVAQAYVSGTPDAPVRGLVLLSPLLEPGRVHYPPLGDEGWGVAGGTLMDGIAGALSWLGPVNVSADTPLFRSIVTEEPALSRLLECPPPGVRSFAVIPLDSGVAAPAPSTIGYSYAVVPSFHGGLLSEAKAQEVIRAVLHDRAVDGSDFWSLVSDVVNAGSAAWQSPSLVTSLEPAWRADLHDSSCRALRAELTRWLG